MRIGAKKRPFYRVVAVDERNKRTGGYIENLGTYNPLTEPKEIKLNQERIDHWVKQGAQLSIGFLRIIGKAPQRKPRKPKKEKKTEPSVISDQTSEKPAEKPQEQEKPKAPVAEAPTPSEPVATEPAPATEPSTSDTPTTETPQPEASQPVAEKEEVPAK